MRVCYVGNFGAEHSTENEIRKAWEHLGHEIECVQEDRHVWAGVAERDVDLVMWTRTADLDRDTPDVKLAALARLRERGIPSAAYHLDRWWGLRRENSVREEPFFGCDFVFTADGGHQEQFEALGINHVWMPPAVSEFECVPGSPRDEYASDIAFVGSWQGYHPEWHHRPALIKFLRHTYGDRVRFWPEPGQPAVRGEALRDLYASVKVVVGDSCLAGGATHYWSDRIPETVGRGAYLIHPWVDGLGAEFVRGHHLDTWHVGTWDVLRFRIDEALEDHVRRERVADAGRSHVLAHHTYTVRMEQLIWHINAAGYFLPVQP